MRNQLLSLLTLFWVIAACNAEPTATGRNGITFKTPADYNDYIIVRQQEVARLIDQFAGASDLNADSARAILQKSSRITGEYLNDLSAMSGFKGDTAFRNAAVKSFTFYKRIFDNEYNELLNINAKGEKASQADQQRAQAISQSLSKEEAELDNRFVSAQREFAQKNKLNIESGASPAAKPLPKP
jgi:hypothetical protein